MLTATALRKNSRPLRQQGRVHSAILPAGTPTPPKFRVPAGSYDPQKDVVYRLKLLRLAGDSESTRTTQSAQSTQPAFRQVGDVYLHFHCGKLVKQLEIHYDGSPARWCDASLGHSTYNLTRQSLITFRGRLEIDNRRFRQLWREHVGESELLPRTTSQPSPLTGSMGAGVRPFLSDEHIALSYSSGSGSGSVRESVGETPRTSIARSIGLQAEPSPTASALPNVVTSPKIEESSMAVLLQPAAEEESSVAIFLQPDADKPAAELCRNDSSVSVEGEDISSMDEARDIAAMSATVELMEIGNDLVGQEMTPSQADNGEEAVAVF